MLRRAALTSHAGFACGAAGAVADASLVAAATGQAALIVLAAVIAAAQGFRTARAVKTGGRALAAGLTAGVRLGAA